MKHKNWCALLFAILLLFCVSCTPAPVPDVTPGDLLDPSPSVKPKNAPPSPEHEPELIANPSPDTPPDGGANQTADRVYIQFHDPDNEKAFPPDIYDLTANFAAQVQGEFTYVDYQNTDIPSGLQELIEKALYDDDFSAPELASPFEIDTKTLPARYDGFFIQDEYNRYVEHVYQYAIDNMDYYLLVANDGGTAHHAYIYIYKDARAGEGLIFCDEERKWGFDHESRAFLYGGDLFFLERIHNFESKYVDAAAVCKLTADGFSDFTTMSLLPNGRFEWETIYDSGSPAVPAVTAYIDSIKNELMSKSPISFDIEVFTGHEEEDYYEIDFNNDGVMEYFARKHRFSPNAGIWLCVAYDFFQFENGRPVYIRLDFENEYAGPLIQLWFAELEGKVYTFRLFLNDGYNYLLNVSMIEGDKVTQIQSQIAASKKEGNRVAGT